MVYDSYMTASARLASVERSGALNEIALLYVA